MDLFEETMTADEGGELHRRNTNEKEVSYFTVGLLHMLFNSLSVSSLKEISY